MPQRAGPAVGLGLGPCPRSGGLTEPASSAPVDGMPGCFLARALRRRRRAGRRRVGQDGQGRQRPPASSDVVDSCRRCGLRAHPVQIHGPSSPDAWASRGTRASRD
eukprot:4876263-Pyramimonas_sp.AAC.1